MKSTGMVRKIDDLGRLCLPIELRRTLEIDEGDSLEIFTEAGGRIILRKYEPACCFCGQAGNLHSFQGKLVCPECAVAIGSLSHRESKSRRPA